MRAVQAILTALSRATRRGLGSFAAIKLNNFFLFVLFLTYSNLLYRLPPHSAYPFLLMIGFLLLFPMSSDPLAKIPSVRLGLWPLGSSQRIVLRLLTVTLSPVFWIALILLALTAHSLALAFVALAIAMQAALFAAGSPRWAVSAWAPRARFGIPGKLGPLVTAAIRQMLSVLDTYLALVLAIAGCAYRYFFHAPDPAAYPIFALLIALALSTYAQCLFGLDSGSALTRYRLLPLPYWQIVVAKDAAYLAILLVLVAPLSVFAGMTSGLIALALGHHASIGRHSIQYRWRFTGGRIIVGVPQGVLGLGLGLAAQQVNPAFLGIAAAAYCVSLAKLSGGTR